MNSWWEWSILNWIIPFWIISLTKQSLKRPARFRMGAQEEKGKKEIPPPMHGWRRDGTWSAFCGCRLCSLGRVGKDRLAQSCPLLLSCSTLPSEQLCKRRSASWVSAPLAHTLHLGQPCTNTSSVQRNHTAWSLQNWNREFGPLSACQQQIHSFSFPCHQS